MVSGAGLNSRTLNRRSVNEQSVNYRSVMGMYVRSTSPM